MQPKKELTPLMQQYWDIKSQHGDEILLFRMGDFFEMFHQDAEVAAPILNIALTQRNKKVNDPTKMCGVPHHSIAGPIAKLLAAGRKVAICDQVEDPAVAKGIVKRAVTRVLTPGMVYDPDTLDQLSANYMSSYDERQIAFADITTGEAFVYDFADTLEREELLALLRPVELVLSNRQVHERTGLPFVTVYSSPADADFSAWSCVRVLKTYIENMQGEEALKALPEFETRRRHNVLRLSVTAMRHLEVFETSRGERQGSLFTALNRTQTSGGARLLKSWLMHPLKQIELIEQRQRDVRLWAESPAVLKSFRQGLARLGDIERRVGKVHSSTFNARDLLAIAESIRTGRELTHLHPGRPQIEGLASVSELAEKITRALNDELPLSVKEGGLIRRGAVRELDELLDLTQNAQKLLVDLEARERGQTGISSLKVRYNNVFGFYIELTKTHAHKAPDHYRRKQTLTNAERFTTDELSALEEKVLSAKSRRDQLEYEIFLKMRQEVIDLTAELLRLSREWTVWDVSSSLAWLSHERGYTCPKFSDGILHLELCRHPVVEQILKNAFVPNTIRLEGGECLLLTGPNMAGKSTVMRQVALIALMAQIGSFVPAQSATLPLFDEIFTRIGASDALNEGLSTFMVEMSETSQILRRVGRHSLVIMDEIGRGTSTYDGLSLAQAILEYLVAEKRPYMLFATHYHELTALSGLYPQIHNAHMSVHERNGEIRFLHTLQKGPANRSYGIHVARLAGLPGKVTARASQLLKGFEGGSAAGMQMSLTDAQTESLDSRPVPVWWEEMKKLNLSQITPLEALNKLFEWQCEP